MVNCHQGFCRSGRVQRRLLTKMKIFVSWGSKGAKQNTIYAVASFWTCGYNEWRLYLHGSDHLFYLVDRNPTADLLLVCLGATCARGMHRLEQLHGVMSLQIRALILDVVIFKRGQVEVRMLLQLFTHQSIKSQFKVIKSTSLLSKSAHFLSLQSTPRRVMPVPF